MAGKPGRSGGRRSTSWTKENRPNGRPKGLKNRRTILREKLGIKNWEQLQNFVETRGIEKATNELMKLSGADLVHAFLDLAEFVKPKLSRAEYVLQGEVKHTVVRIGGKPIDNSKGEKRSASKDENKS